MAFSTLENKIENFSHLSDQECALLISSNLLELLESDLYIEWEIVAKFMTIPFENRDALCKIFNSAIKRNEQKIAGVPVNDWLKQYLENYAFKERGTNTFYDYISNNTTINKLDQNDKLKLARIFRMYDYLFVKPVFDFDGPIMNVLKFTMLPKSKQERSNTIELEQQQAIEPQRIITESININNALAKYPLLNDQIVTMQHIKIQNFPNPVRPTIKNWLADYTFSVGYGAHNSMVRNNYLFQNSNTKILNSLDREKLAYILKSFDEQTPVTVDTTNKQIIFHSFNQPSARTQSLAYNPPTHNPTPVKEFKPASIPQTPPSPPTNNQRVSSSRPVYNLDEHDNQYQVPTKPIFSPAKPARTENIKFSSSQKLPFEKEMEKKREAFSAPETNKAHDMHRTEQSASRPQTKSINDNFQSSLHDKWERQESWPNKTPLISHERTIPIQPTPNPPQPLRIHPVSPYNGNNNGHNNKHETDEEELPKNVVNLKNS